MKALQAFVKLGENGCDFSIHKELGLSRSDLWFLVTQLEKKTRLKLVIRKKKNNALTKEGVCFLPYAQQVLRILEKGLAEASLVQSEKPIQEIQV